MQLVSMGPAEFGISPTHGFLPELPPLPRLPEPFDPWENAAHDLPKLLIGDSLREHLDNLPPFDLAALEKGRQTERAMVLLSYLVHGYVWSGDRPSERIPANLALPWHSVARALGRPPVLSYASYCLHNWRLLDPNRPVEAGNIALIQNFLGGEDEEWFVLIHADIEMRAAPAIGGLLDLRGAIQKRDESSIGSILEQVASALQEMNRTMDRMPEHCDPYIYFRRVRTYIHGWRDHPDLPNGLVYEGVAEYEGRPQRFRGETGAQSGIIPSFDAALGIEHACDHLRSYLLEMRDYMPPGHRRYLETLESGPSLRDFVTAASKSTRSIYNECVDGVERFRTTHLQFAAAYIHKQAQSDAKNPNDVGTGGTPFMPYLKKHRDETQAHLLAG